MKLLRVGSWQQLYSLGIRLLERIGSCLEVLRKASFLGFVRGKYN